MILRYLASRIDPLTVQTSPCCILQYPFTEHLYAGCIQILKFSYISVASIFVDLHFVVNFCASLIASHLYEFPNMSVLSFLMIFFFFLLEKTF